MSSAAGRRTRLWGVAIGGAVGIASLAAGWLVTDRLERDDDFCNACHLATGVPLHIGIRRDFDRAPAVSLAGRHAAAGVEGREPGAFRCIDCHGGVGMAGRLRVKVLAAKDAFWYLVGHFEEPVQMRWPLRDEDCGRCHASFDTRKPASWEPPRFHQLPVHNVELGVRCVACHRSHGDGGDPGAHFLVAGRVRRHCARCHPEFEEGRG